MAGTGKTTIAHSIAEFYDHERLLGASFFFSRDQQNRRESRYLFQTIAFQLGSAFPTLKLAIADALKDQGILTSNLRSQLRRLIIGPVLLTMEHLPHTIVIVLDALDECEDGDAITKIIELFVQTLRGCSLPLRIFVTSRPESHIRSTFYLPEIQPETRPFILHEIALEEVQMDIDKFVRFELGRIARAKAEIFGGEPWPDEVEIQKLVTHASGLFIAAATMLKFICPDRRTRNPRARLAFILNDSKEATFHWSASFPFQSLDHLYAKILEHATEGAQPRNVYERFRVVVGTIVLAFSYLTTQDLEMLLLQGPGQVDLALGELHSIVVVPERGRVRTFHPSFRDFLTDNSRCTDSRFFIDSQTWHAEIARFCILRMKKSLRRDICEIGDHTKLNSEVENMKEKKATHLPGDLQYACRFWMQHFCSGLVNDSLVDLVYSFAFESILYWIEVLSLIGELRGCMGSLRLVQEKLAVRYL
jgi:hypothetical protein